MKMASCLLIWVSIFIVIVVVFDLRFLGRISITNTKQNDGVVSTRISNNKSKESFLERHKRKKKKKKGSYQQISGLSCEEYGGPSDEIASEMVYWKDIPIDRRYKNPYYDDNNEQAKYITMEPDAGDWNNKRMALETAAVIALVTGRVLVLPPSSNNVFYKEIFPFENISSEYNLRVMTMEEFLKTEGLTGNLKDKQGNVKIPEKTNWDGDNRHLWEHPLWPYLRDVTTPIIWDKDDCIAGIPSRSGKSGEERLKEYFAMAKGRQDAPEWDNEGYKLRIESYTANPTPVDAPPQDRLREMLAKRNKLCLYDEQMHNTKYLHVLGDGFGRLLSHFYALLFFEDWRQDLWVKRFVRDHFRYVDELQCGAARIVDALRQISIQNGDTTGAYDTFHIRRGDFLNFRGSARVDANEIYQRSKSVLVEGSVVYIATDERDKSFFNPLKEHYQVYYLDDFQELISGIGMSKFGQLDQLVASRGRTFVGLFFSTFTGYITRMRAYHAMNDKIPGYEEGIQPSYYYADHEFKYSLRQYRSMSWPIWAREYPVAWRDIDHDVLEEDVK